MELEAGVWIASDSQGWWKMTSEQLKAWKSYKTNYEGSILQYYYPFKLIQLLKSLR